MSRDWNSSRGARARAARAMGAGEAWKLWLVVGVAMTAGYFALPSQALQDILYQVPGMLAAVAVAVGIVIHRPIDARPWWLLTIGLALSSIGDWTWVVLDRAYGLEPFPSVADVFYLGGMALVAASLLWLVRGRVPGGDRAGILDALIVAVGAGMLSWLFVMTPIVADPNQSATEIAVALAYPVLDILLLGIMVRLFLAPGRHVTSLWFLIGALIAFLLADLPYAVLALEGVYQTGNLVDGGWLLGSALWGAAALHPSMRHVADQAELGERHFSVWRMVLLAGASLMAPAVLVIQAASGGPIDVPVIAIGCVVLFLLVIARLDGVVGDLRATLAQRRVLEVELERRALHDPLTGLANRVLFHDRLRHALASRDGQVAVLFLDLDDFKTVNDTWGHAAGDSLLTEVAHTVRRAVRDHDTVARLGGDEFAVLLEDAPDIYAAGQVAGKLITAVAAPVSIAGNRLATGVSIGVSLGGHGTATAEDLMRDADIAMYVAKGKGKGRFVIFESNTHEHVVRGLELRGDMERALREKQFEMHYQPIVHLASGSPVGVEALVRWRHPTRGLLLPADFIPLAESTGAILPMGRWILAQACEEAAQWTATQPDGGDESPERLMAINLSAIQLMQPDFGAFVRSTVEASGVDPGRILLELTETSRLDHDEASANLAELGSLGVGLAIDDFGTGFAALSQLSRIPFDIVKIDRSFVARLFPGSRGESLITGIVDLAHRLGMNVVAEGIESAEQLTRLREMGCTYGQGFYLASPMRASELRDYFRNASSPADSASMRRPAPVVGRARSAAPS